MSQGPLEGARAAVEDAQAQQELGHEEEAERLYQRAARLYIDAGIDPHWFMAGQTPEERDPLDLYWLFPTSAVEATEYPGEEEPAGIVIDVRDLQAPVA